MDFLCKVCDREILENELERNIYLVTLRKAYYRSLNKKFTINNINFDGFDTILSDYISHHNKKCKLYLYKITFELEFDNNSLQSKPTNHRLNVDKNYMKSCLLACIEYFILRGYKF